MQLPPIQVTRAVIQKYARVRQRYVDDLGERPLVVPNATFFPDRFERDAGSLARIVERMQAHAGMRDIPIVPEIVDSVSGLRAEDCNSGGCCVPSNVSSGQPRLVDEGDRWRLQVPGAELKHSVALTTNLARSLAFIFLVETQKEGELIEPPVDVTADFVAVALGFGPLLLQGAYIYAKSCGGPQVASVTKVTVGELAIAVALFAALGDHPIGPVLKDLDTTQRAVLSEARELVRANRSLVEILESDPRRIVEGRFELETPGSFLSNWMRRRRQAKTGCAIDQLDATMELDELEQLLITMPPSSSAGRVQSRPSAPPLSAQENQERQELRELVGEALASARPFA